MRRIALIQAKPSSEIVREVKVDTPIFDMGDVENAIQHCRWGEELVVVAGSIFLVGAVKDIWEQQTSVFEVKDSPAVDESET